MESINVDQSETLEMTQQEDMMNSWSKERVGNHVLKNGYWFILCASIESAWEDCERRLIAGELDDFYT